MLSWSGCFFKMQIKQKTWMRGHPTEDASLSYLLQWVRTQTHWHSDRWGCGGGWVLLKTQTPPADSSAHHEMHQTYKAKTAIKKIVLHFDYDWLSHIEELHCLEDYFLSISYHFCSRVFKWNNCKAVAYSKQITAEVFKTLFLGPMAWKMVISNFFHRLFILIWFKTCMTSLCRTQKYFEVFSNMKVTTWSHIFHFVCL